MTEPTPEFSRPIAISLIGPQEQEHRIEASPAERRALAKRFDLVELASLVAVVRLRRPVAGGLVRVEAEFTADVVQSCVVTLEPIRTRIADEIVLHFGRERAASAENGVEVEVLLEDDDPPEPIANGEIDIGEAVSQGLALALDPYPRKPGAAVEAEANKAAPGAASAGPFAALARLCKKE